MGGPTGDSRLCICFFRINRRCAAIEAHCGHIRSAILPSVQKFYDWYWNQFADDADKPNFDLHKLHDYHEDVRLQPSVLSPELIVLIKKDEKCSKRSQGICNLDFDPFWGNQDAQGKYVVGRVAVEGDHCVAQIIGQQVTPELKKSGPTWVFSNFRYTFYSDDKKTMEAPDSDLIRILK